MKYRSVSLPGLSGELSRDFAGGALLQRIAELPRWLEQGERLKQDPGRAVIRLSPGGALPDLLAKCYMARSWRERLKQWLGLARPALIHRRLRHLPASGSPLCLSLGHVRLLDGTAVWLTPLLEGRSLLYRAGPALPEIPQQQSELLVPVIEAMVALHARGLVHGDFKWANVLVDEAGGRVQLIDPDGVRICPAGTTGPRQIRDLARFLLDCEEAGVTPDIISQLTARYCSLRPCEEGTLRRPLERTLNKLRRRHRARYGANHRLLPPNRS